MAEANAVDECVILPHTVYDRETLRRLFPPLEVHEAVDAGDPLEMSDGQDAIVCEGQKVVEAMNRHVSTHGRRRVERL